MHHGRKQTLSYPELLASGSPFTPLFQSSPPPIPLVSQSLLLPAYLWQWLGVVVVVIVCGGRGHINLTVLPAIADGRAGLTEPSWLPILVKGQQSQAPIQPVG